MFSHLHHRFAVGMLCLYILFTLSLLVSTPTTRAAGMPIEINSRSASLTFPKAIDFNISAHDTQAPLSEATLYLSYEGFDYQASHHITVSSATPSFTFQWHDDLTTNSDQFPPVGTHISYYWTISDTAGNRYSDRSQSIDVVDNRFHWQHLSKGLYQVNWYNRGTNFGQMMLGQVDTELQSISHNLGGSLKHDIHLWVYQDANDFQGSLPPNAHEWVGGIAFPSISSASIVVQSADDDTLQRDMPHELTHLVLHQLILPTIAPTWFDEGMAVYNQNYHESDLLVRFKTALNHHDLLPLTTITQNFPADANKAYLAYAESWQLVAYLYQTFGLPKITRLIHALDTPHQNFDTDMRQTLGVDMAHLENQWHLSLGQSPTLSPDQLTEPVSTSPPLPNPYDQTTLALLLLGMSLVIGSLLGLAGLAWHRRRVQQRAWQHNYVPQHNKLLWHSQIPETPYPNNYPLPPNSTLPDAQQSSYPPFPSHTSH